jgi:DNA-binding LacI/PurR family transcriptional regulator
VHQPTATIAHRAAECLLDRIEGRANGERRDLCLDCEVVIRQSTVGRAATAISM